MKNNFFTLAAVIALSTLAYGATAQAPTTPKAQYATDSKVALDRYENDKKLCNDETSSTARLQCRRDAKAEYDKAVATAKVRLDAAGPHTTATAKPSNTAVACADCGKVVAVSVTEKEGEGGAVGMVAGGVVGGLLGHQVGGGLGKDLATIAGAAGGAYAGKVIEGKVKTHKVWHVSVQYANGNKHSFEFDKDPGFAVGEAVKNSGGSIVRN